MAGAQSEDRIKSQREAVGLAQHEGFQPLADAAIADPVEHHPCWRCVWIAHGSPCTDLTRGEIRNQGHAATDTC